MSGMQQLMLSAGHFAVSLPTIEETGGANQATAQFGTDGTLTITDGSTTTQSLTWGTPAITGIGSSYWVKVVNGVGSSSDWTLTAATWYQLSSARTFTSPFAEGSSNTGTVYLSTTNADSGIVASASITLTSP